MRESRRFVLVLIVGLMLAQHVFCQTSAVPFLLNYQGKVTKTDGTPLDGPGYTVSFSLWDSATGGANLWSQTITGVVLTKGVFHVLLGGSGSTKSLGDLPWDKTYYLEIGITGIAQFTERTPIVSVPFAFRAQDAYMVGGKKADGTANNLPVLDGQGKLAGTIISPGTVTSDQLAPKAVKSANLDDKAVTAGKIDANAVGELQIAAGAIKAEHIGNQQVQANHIVDGKITSLQLSRKTETEEAAVATANIQDKAITAEKLSMPPIPLGGIIAYWGRDDQIPAGWQLCDGKPFLTGSPLVGTTPNLVDRFIRGTSGNVTTPVYAGADRHTHSLQNHTHGTNDGGFHAHGDGDGYRAQMTGTRGGALWGNGASTQGAADHNHGSTGGPSTNNTDEVDNIPRYVGLLYIMRVL